MLERIRRSGPTRSACVFAGPDGGAAAGEIGPASFKDFAGKVVLVDF